MQDQLNSSLKPCRDLRRIDDEAESSVEIVRPAALLLSVLDTHLKRCVG